MKRQVWVIETKFSDGYKPQSCHTYGSYKDALNNIQHPDYDRIVKYVPAKTTNTKKKK